MHEPMQKNPAEIEFWQSDRLFRLLVESAEEYAIFTMDREGRITSWNPGAERLLGWNADEVMEKSGALIFTEEDRAVGIPERKIAQAASEGRAEDTRWHVRKSGECFWASGVVTSIEGKTNEPVGFATILRDLTEEKRYEETLEANTEALEKRTEELERSNRTLEAFASHVAHEMRSPLMGMRLVIDSLLRTYAEIFDEETLERLYEVREAIHDLDQFTSDLLAYARLEGAPQSREYVASEEALQKSLSDLRVLIEERSAVVEVAGELLEVWANPTQLRHLFRNLVSNAIEHNDAEVPRVRIEAKDEEDAWIFRIIDNGPGIPDEKREKIFELFQQGRDEDPGVGVGLTLCKRIVEAHGGRIGVEPKSGRGATFRFTLPKSPGNV